MEIQYAIFCEQVKFPDKPRGKFILTQPITSPTFPHANAVEINMPLFATFINGETGRNYNLKVIVVSSSGEPLNIREFIVTWTGDSTAQADCFTVPLPLIHNSDTLTFTLYLDEIEQGKLRVPITLLP